MIKAKDLRIGDLVRVCEGNWQIKKDTICKVIGIDWENQNENSPGWVTISTQECLSNKMKISCKDIEGIPLTCDNLNNNGWGANQIGMHEFLVYDEDSDMYLEWSDIDDRYTFNDFFRSKNFLTVRYIHELQHILWALGKSSDINI